MTQPKAHKDGNDTVGAQMNAETEAALETPLLLTDPSPASIPTEPIVDEEITAKPSASPNRSGGLFGALIGGILAAMAGFGLAKYVPGGWPIQDIGALQAQIDSQANEIQDLKAAQTKPGNLDEIEHRLAALETTLANPAPIDLKPLQDRIASLDSALSALKNASGDGNVAERLLQIQTRINALEAGSTLSPEALAAADNRVKEAEAAAAASKAGAEKAALLAKQAVALSKISAALESGAAFSDALEGLGAAVPEGLSAVSQEGVPTVAALQSAFPEAARRALDAALRADMGGSWTDRAATFLKTQTGVRSLNPREGDDPDAILSRAEAAVASGDLQTAVSELAALPKDALDQMSDWQALAQKRMAATRAFIEFSASLGQ